MIVVTACGPVPHRVALVGNNATLQSGCAVSILDAWVRDREIMVKLWVNNLSQDVDLRLYKGFSLIVGGISFATDPRERVVGEIPMLPGDAHR